MLLVGVEAPLRGRHTSGGPGVLIMSCMAGSRMTTRQRGAAFVNGTVHTVRTAVCSVQVTRTMGVGSTMTRATMGVALLFYLLRTKYFRNEWGSLSPSLRNATIILYYRGP